jgi:hypothetical protein
MGMLVRLLELRLLRIAMLFFLCRLDVSGAVATTTTDVKRSRDHPFRISARDGTLSDRGSDREQIPEPGTVF